VLANVLLSVIFPQPFLLRISFLEARKMHIRLPTLSDFTWPTKHSWAGMERNPRVLTSSPVDKTPFHITGKPARGRLNTEIHSWGG